MTTFTSSRSGFGTIEWAEFNQNISNGCSNDCLYCYAAEMAARFKRKDRNDWHREELTKHALLSSYPNRDGVVMFPSTHDITFHNLIEYVRVAKLILASGNQLLIVSKPRLECIKALIEELAPWKEHILFRLTIGSMDSAVTKFWEPGASCPKERLACLQAAFDAGFNTSISIEPMLQGSDEAIQVVSAVSPYVTETIWVGKMNQAQRRVDTQFQAQLLSIKQAQSDANILHLHEMLQSNPAIRWKESIKKVLLNYEI
jgi:DNA repair photolyase